jgi:dipeptidyl aminopeptidase/acylaminoacyl peptidase
LPGQVLAIVDESWDRRFYLIHASSDVDPGVYYRFDSQEGVLSKITSVYPWLEDFDLARMQPLEFLADDGTSIPGYLTLPAPTSSDGSTSPRPLVVFPHGGPRARDDWGFDWIPQFLAARGYAVLQANYRGSDGLGEAWVGDGAYKDWKRAMKDVDAGVLALIDQGIADPDRICIAGWSYGGYAALISAIEFPERYQCAVSIAGVTDPYRLLSEAKGRERAYRKTQIPQGAEEMKLSSPLRRSDETQVPILLFHGDMDRNVPVDHSRDLEKSLRKSKKQVEYIEYEGADHHITKQSDRIDMLQRIGDFLAEHLVRKKPTD